MKTNPPSSAVRPELLPGNERYGKFRYSASKMPTIVGTASLFPIICFLLVLSGNIQAKTIIAASAELRDVQAAVAAAVDYDTVRIPAGTATWMVKYQTDYIRIDKRALTIMGAGIDKTVLKMVNNSGAATPNYPFFIIGQEGKPVRICHMTIAASELTTENVGGIAIQGTCKTWRVDHIKFLNVLPAMNIHSPGARWAGGLIDHCDFEMIKLPKFNCAVVCIWPSGGGDSAYTKPLSLGTAEALYIEDTRFYYSTKTLECGNVPLMPPQDGLRLVARHDTIINTDFEIYRITGGTRGSLSCEIYNNAFISEEGELTNQLIGISGGTGVIFNNTVTGTAYDRYTIEFHNDRICTPYGKYGKCDGTSPYDGNQIPAGQPGAGYPCLDQPGRGVDTTGDGIQEPAPWYEWNNTINGRDLDFSVDPWRCDGQIPQYIQEGREYYNDTPMPGYKPYVYPHPLAKGDASPGISRISELNGSSGFLQVVSSPFSRSISIKLNGSSTQQSGVRIYNLRGQEVADLTPLFAGKSQIQWDANGLKNGVYLVQAKVGGQVHTARALLQR